MKKRWARVLSVGSVALFAFHLYALSILAGSAPGGAGWWARLLLILGPLVVVAALALSLRAPRQEVMAILCGLLILFYLGVWVQVIPTLRSGGGP